MHGQLLQVIHQVMMESRLLLVTETQPLLLVSSLLDSLAWEIEVERVCVLFC